ncbi:recombinase family protein [Cetobacterium sp. SF1]|uniref:recombinase family protein n=1 Tax=Cetobacterium sp. SF1 TaxID=3417654 RepID=UPI003CF042B8
MIFGYCRISTTKQNLTRQIEALKKYGVSERFIFIDRCSGSSLDNRPAFKELLTLISPKDTLVIKELDRLGRNRKEIKELILYFIDKDINIECLDMPYFNSLVLEKIKNSDSFLEIIATTILDILLEIAEEERKKIIQRTSEGRKHAISIGKKFGRPEKIDLSKFKDLYLKYKSRELKAIEIQKKLNISKQTFYNYIKKIEK